LRPGTEAELCDAFLDALEPGWTAYPETAGWDILLVCETGFDARTPDQKPVEAGTQVGVEAKLRGNLTVLRQALPGRYVIGKRSGVLKVPGPDHRSVLVPKTSPDFEAVASALNLLVITAKPNSHGRPFRQARDFSGYLMYREPWVHKERHELPEVVPDVRCGVPSPITVSRWKIRAIKLCIILRDRGYLTAADFKAEGVDIRRWKHQWLVPGEKRGQWVRASGWTPWDEVHPGVVAQLEARVDSQDRVVHYGA
jgi:hypothetical protein